MILVKSPFRISFAGGGTDLASYYSHGYGAVISTTIRKYMHIVVNRKFDRKIRLFYYDSVELVTCLDDLKHGIIREALLATGIDQGIEIAVISDIPGRGSGLGSSSSLAVGTLRAFHAYMDRNPPVRQLAEEACRIEIDQLAAPIGKQDQYAAAYGGLNYFVFNADGSVDVEPLDLPASIEQKLEASLLGFYTGFTRKANTILANLRKSSESEKRQYMDRIRDQAVSLRSSLQRGDLAGFGELLHQGWLLKKSLTEGVSTPILDAYYDRAREAGALGGRIAGAGGGGFLVLYAPPECHASIRLALSDLQEIPLRFEREGARVVYQEAGG